MGSSNEWTARGRTTAGPSSLPGPSPGAASGSPSGQSFSSTCPRGWPGAPLREVLELLGGMPAVQPGFCRKHLAARLPSDKRKQRPRLTGVPFMLWLPGSLEPGSAPRGVSRLSWSLSRAFVLWCSFWYSSSCQFLNYVPKPFSTCGVQRAASARRDEHGAKPVLTHLGGRRQGHTLGPPGQAA